jgi:peptide deformylase
LPAELRKEAMKEIRQAEWFLAASESGTTPEIRLSPHSTFGKGL